MEVDMLYSAYPTIEQERMTRLRIKEEAVAKGLDIAKLSRRADLAYRTVWQLWNEPERDVTVGTLKKIADALGVQVTDLIENEPLPPAGAERGAA
jgi:DNA-binding Xre family transcriptional regulator